jgi:hypothetical protein
MVLTLQRCPFELSIFGQVPVGELLYDARIIRIETAAAVIRTRSHKGLGLP